MDFKTEYQRWLLNVDDEDVARELHNMSETQIEDSFYRDLTFGTGGLRGIIGAGTNRMNIYTVAKASQGLANYLLKNCNTVSIVIGYDSRIKSDVFAQVAAGVFAANGIIVRMWPELLPVPTVSYAVRKLDAAAGVMITASHNPSKYNGYKVYGSDGCQITTEAVAEILAEIEKLDIFTDVKADSNMIANFNLKDDLEKNVVSSNRKTTVYVGGSEPSACTVSSGREAFSLPRFSLSASTRDGSMPKSMQIASSTDIHFFSFIPFSPPVKPCSSVYIAVRGLSVRPQSEIIYLNYYIIHDFIFSFNILSDFLRTGFRDTVRFLR